MSSTATTEVQRWWEELPDGARRELIWRWGVLPLAGSEARSFEVAILEAESVDDLDGPDDPGGWNRDLYEYIVGRPVLGFFLDGRRFYIGCRAHPSARRAVRAGRIEATFRCPRSRRDCPMRALIRGAGGRSVRLRLSLPLAPRSPAQVEPGSPSRARSTCDRPGPNPPLLRPPTAR